MNIEHLAYLIEVYHCGSINKAARYFYISQSHLSKIIKSMENELGYTLFIRSKHGLEFTRAGIEFIKVAEKIVKESKNIKRIPEKLQQSESLNMICSSDPFLLNTFFRFRQTMPQSNANETLEEAGLRIILQRLIAGERDMGIMAMYEKKFPKYQELAERYGLCFEMLQTHIPMIAVMRKNHPLANGDTISFQDLEAFPLVVDSNVDYDDNEAILPIKCNKNLLYVSSLACTEMALKYSNHVAVKNETITQHMLENGLTTRPIEGFHEYSAFYLLHNKSKPLSVRETQYIKFLKEQLLLRFSALPHA